MKESKMFETPFGIWSVEELAHIAAEGCYTPNGKDRQKFAMQVVIENLVLDDSVSSYTVEELASAIVKCLTPRAADGASRRR